jgi:hypothetical protein
MFFGGFQVASQAKNFSRERLLTPPVPGSELNEKSGGKRQTTGHRLRRCELPPSPTINNKTCNNKTSEHTESGDLASIVHSAKRNNKAK